MHTSILNLCVSAFLSVCVCHICVCTCVSSLIFRGLGFIFLYGGSPILIKSWPIRVSSWLKALESVTLLHPETQKSRRQAAERHGVTIKIQIAGVPLYIYHSVDGCIYERMDVALSFRFNAPPRPPFMESLKILHYH